MKKSIMAVAVCAILGIAIYTGYYFLTDSFNDNPIPEPLPIDSIVTRNTDTVDINPEPTANPADIWTDLSIKTNTTSIPNSTTQPDADQYPIVISEDDDEVVIDFTDPEKGKTPSPDADKSSKSGSDSDAAGQDGQKTAEPPATPKPTATPKPVATPKPTATPKPAATPKPTTTPKADNNGGSNTRSDGAVYDPVFGWVIPSKTVQIPATSDGDINKMVGSMGGD